jgi:hypothetical protein
VSAARHRRPRQQNPHAAVLTFTAAQWQNFTHKIKTSAYGQPGPR